MNRAQRKAVELRRKLGLRGKVDAEAVANRLGLTVQPWPMDGHEELRVDDVICVAQRLGPDWRRWVVAHSIGHRLMHPGNHTWTHIHTKLGYKYEREAEDFACAFLIDAQEVVEAGLTESWDVAEYFGVPDEMVRLAVAAHRGVPVWRDGRVIVGSRSAARGAPGGCFCPARAATA